MMASTSQNETCMIQEQKVYRPSQGINRGLGPVAEQGTISLEFSFGGELGLKEHVTGCRKNPGHRNFIPFSSLTMQDFPEPYRAEPIMGWVLYKGELTAKVTVRYVSLARPPQCPLNCHKGTDLMTTGTGSVTEFVNYRTDIKCPFGDKCEESTVPHTVCGYFRLTTAAHVVFDDEEAKNTELTFFFDRDGKDKSSTMKARAVRVITRSVEGDWCDLECVTHDERLCLKLMAALKHTSLKFVTDPTRVKFKKLLKKCACSLNTVLYFTRLRTLQCLKKLLSEMRPDSVEKSVASPGEQNDTSLAVLLEQEGLLKKLSDEDRERMSVFLNLLPRRPVEGKDVALWKPMWKELTEQLDSKNQGLLEHLQVMYIVSCLYPEDLYENLSLLDTSNMQRKIEILDHFVQMDRDGQVKLSKNDNPLTGVSIKSMSSMDESLRGMLSSINKKGMQRLNHWLYSMVQHMEHKEHEKQLMDVFEIHLLSPVAFTPAFDLKSLLKHLQCSVCEKLTLQILQGLDYLHMELKGLCTSLLSMSYLEACLPSIPYSELSPYLDEYDISKGQNEMGMAVVISHPHGQAKHVTFGEPLALQTDTGFYSYTYTAPTCSGSSGAPVWLFTPYQQTENDGPPLYNVVGTPHCRFFENDVNRSSSYTFY